jgi:hypothetical protein
LQKVGASGLWIGDILAATSSVTNEPLGLAATNLRNAGFLVLYILADCPLLLDAGAM